MLFLGKFSSSQFFRLRKYILIFEPALKIERRFWLDQYPPSIY